MSIATATFIDKCRISHDGRRELSFYILEAPDEEAVREWVKENVFFQPYILGLWKGERHGLYIAKVEEWVD
jgi:hypothetical protein